MRLVQPGRSDDGGIKKMAPRMICAAPVSQVRSAAT
jgi:hypothetical protein